MAEGSDAQNREIQGLVPRPDPTLLTTEQLRREIAGVEKALDAFRELYDSKIESQSDIIGERFRSVDKQLVLVERQRVEQKEDTKAAVDAALTAQKEAVKEQTTASERAIAKSEAATTKQLDQQALTFRTAIEGLTDLVNDVKERVGKLESIKQGSVETRDRFSQSWGIVLVGLGVFVAVILGVAGLIVNAGS
jgi:chemotaxis protein histidine kinase CheA